MNPPDDPSHDHPPTPVDPARQRIVRRLRRLARWLDSSIRLPGGGRIGVDPLLGLVPVVGDTISLAISTYIILEARRLGVDKPTVRKMVINVLIDWAIGSIPIAGQAADFFIKANERNLRLIGIDPDEVGKVPPSKRQPRNA